MATSRFAGILKNAKKRLFEKCLSILHETHCDTEDNVKSLINVVDYDEMKDDDTVTAKNKAVIHFHKKGRVLFDNLKALQDMGFLSDPDARRTLRHLMFYFNDLELQIALPFIKQRSSESRSVTQKIYTFLACYPNALETILVPMYYSHLLSGEKGLENYNKIMKLVLSDKNHHMDDLRNMRYVFMMLQDMRWKNYILQPWRLRIQHGDVIQIRTNTLGLRYRLLDLDDQEKQGMIAWKKLPNFPISINEIIAKQDELLPTLLEITSKRKQTRTEQQASDQVSEIVFNEFYGLKIRRPPTEREPINPQVIQFLFDRLIDQSISENIVPDMTEALFYLYRVNMIDRLFIDNLDAKKNYASLLKSIETIPNLADYFRKVFYMLGTDEENLAGGGDPHHNHFFFADTMFSAPSLVKNIYPDRKLDLCLFMLNNFDIYDDNSQDLENYLKLLTHLCLWGEDPFHIDPNRENYKAFLRSLPHFKILQDASRKLAVMQTNDTSFRFENPAEFTEMMMALIRNAEHAMAIMNSIEDWHKRGATNLKEIFFEQIRVADNLLLEKGKIVLAKESLLSKYLVSEDLQRQVLTFFMTPSPQPLTEFVLSRIKSKEELEKIRDDTHYAVPIIIEEKGEFSLYSRINGLWGVRPFAHDAAYVKAKLTMLVQNHQDALNHGNTVTVRKSGHDYIWLASIFEMLETQHQANPSAGGRLKELSEGMKRPGKKI
jgi:hypothetical protein